MMRFAAPGPRAARRCLQPSSAASGYLAVPCRGIGGGPGGKAPPGAAVQQRGHLRGQQQRSIGVHDVVNGHSFLPPLGSMPGALLQEAVAAREDAGAPFAPWQQQVHPMHEPVPLDASAKSTPANVIWRMNQGNKRYVSQRSRQIREESSEPLVQRLLDNPLQPVPVSALVIGDSRVFNSIGDVLDMKPGELQVVRVTGNVCTDKDGLVGSVEFLVEQDMPPVLLVLSTSKNAVVDSAIRLAMTEAGRAEDIPSGEDAISIETLENLALVQKVLPAARDAMMQQPLASFERLFELTAQLNVWKSIEALICSSEAVAACIATGKMEVHGAYFRTDSGRVSFWGQHPSQQALLQHNRTSEAIRTAEDPPVPADEAVAALYAGNRRYAIGKGGLTKVHCKTVLHQLSESGQNPIAVVVGCADSRAPIEILFDMRPGDLFVLRNAGNTCNVGACSLTGSAEYAIAHLRCKLVVITGHTKCGAVTAAVELARQREEANVQTSIGRVLGNLTKSATEAVRRLPEGTMEDQVRLATQLNIFETIEKLIHHSEIIRKGVQSMELQVQGAIYDLFSGTIDWLGQHPELEQIADKSLPLHRWKVDPYIKGLNGNIGRSPNVVGLLDELRAGNRRFIRGESAVAVQEEARKPMALVLCGSDVRMPMNRVFDVGSGALVVQRVLGGIQLQDDDTLIASLEYAVERWNPKLLVVLGGSDSKIVETALQQIAGAEAPSDCMRELLADLMVSALRATRQVEGENVNTAAGRDKKIKQLTVELNAFYTIEQLMVSSTIRGATRRGLELHAAVLDEFSGEVEFLGEHPKFEELMVRAEGFSASKAA